VDVTRLVDMGVPYQRIVETASAKPVDLIVMATHGRTGWARGPRLSRALLIRAVPEQVKGLGPRREYSHTQSPVQYADLRVSTK
jgi:nucleotide-binding universal stress UspA family protein